MFITSEYRDVEPKCYEADHISKVEALIKKNFACIMFHNNYGIYIGAIESTLILGAYGENGRMVAN